MPSTIPYDPSLVLSSVVEPAMLQAASDIAKAEEPVEAKQDALNSLLASKRSLNMTKDELANLGVPTDAIDKELQALDESIKKAGADYAQAKITTENATRTTRTKAAMSIRQLETPVDLVKSQIKTLPLAADSLNMDIRYFSMDDYGRDIASYSKAVSNFVSGQTKFLGSQVQTQATEAAQKQASNRSRDHKLDGTLVLSITCTHKNATILAPFILNVNKGIKVWNTVFPQYRFDPTGLKQADLMKILVTEGNGDGATPAYSIVSGTTFGSGFIGMVHILNASNTSINQNLESIAASLQAKLDGGSLSVSRPGGFGISSSIGRELKQLLSAQHVESQVTSICLGVIPSILSDDIEMGADTLAAFNPKSTMEAVASLQNARVEDEDSVRSAAEAARSGQDLSSSKVGDTKSAISALVKLDDGNGKVRDIDSMMTALEDYLNKAMSGTAGVPINYYLKDVTKDMLAEMWVAKYFPGRFTTERLTESETKE